MFAYNPEQFASLYDAEPGQRIWAFLTDPENARIRQLRQHVNAHGYQRVCVSRGCCGGRDADV